MAADSQQKHRPGAFKQQNKSHKTGRHRSKGQVEKDFKGRVSVKTISRKAKQAVSKQQRRNQAQQVRKNKREEVLVKKRSRGGSDSPPLLVALVALCEGLDTQSALDLIKTADETATVTDSNLNTCYISVPRFKQRVGFLLPPHGNLYALLDAVRVADAVVFLVSPEFGIDEYGDHCLSCLFAQGLASSVVVVQGLKKIPAKKQSETKKFIQKVIHKRFSHDKYSSLDTAQDGLLLLRNVGSQKLARMPMREHRPHLLADNVSYELNSEQANEGTLKLSGYVRGKALSVNGLVHLPGWGDFQMLQIDAPTDPFPLNQRVDKGRKKDTMETGENIMMEEDVKVLEKANPAKQTTLLSENEPDPMEGEQTWPTEEELMQAEEEYASKKKVTRRVPKGTSEYQAAWILDEEGEQGDEEEEDEESSESEGEAMMEDDDDEDDNDDDNDDKSQEDEDEEQEEEEEEEYETMRVHFNDQDEKYDAEFDAFEEEKLLVKYKDARLDEQFPDEIDTPQNVAARTRFQRYRGLKSFRTSPWDPKENLPTDYSRIFQFADFRRSKKRVLNEEQEEGAMPGWYITVHVKDVPKAFMESYTPGAPIVLFGLLPHEHKMSVVNLALKRYHGSTVPVKSKERMVFHVGYRRFAACPVYSQHTTGDRHKFERYLRSDSAAVATLYAPIMFPPASVLMFREAQQDCHELIATGSLLSTNPDRIVAKRIVISGHPFKINRRSAVVRYMFFNREDIVWFKPVELRTKWGRRGHIRECLGTHGHMKCVFDGQLKSQDTVLMNLYKRVYPKWTYDPRVAAPLTTSGGMAGKDEEEGMDEFFD